jgi:hypothetical protein
MLCLLADLKKLNKNHGRICKKVKPNFVEFGDPLKVLSSEMDPAQTRLIP